MGIQKTRAVTFDCLMGLLLAVAEAACSSGGGGGMTPAIATGGNSPPSQTASIGSSASSSGNTALMAGIAVAASPGSFGDSPLQPQIATAGGPTFDGSSGPLPTNVSFPVLSSALQFDSGAAMPATNNQSATATISADSSTVRLVVPSANLNQNLPLSGTPAVPTPEGWNLSGLASSFNTDYVSTWGLSYVSLGLWLHSGAKGSTPQVAFTAYAFGYETPAAGMPTSGSAAYSGPGAVRGDLSIAPPTGTNPYLCADCNFWVSGDASFSVNFASGNIDGRFTNMTNHGDSGVLPWYDISVGGQIASGTNKFSGTTSISPQQSLGVGNANGNGVINGAFYGPNAQNLGAIWTLTGQSFSALGAVAATH